MKTLILLISIKRFNYRFILENKILLPNRDSLRNNV